MLSLLIACRSSRQSDVVSDFILPAVRGGTFQLRSATPQPALLAFLQAVPDTADTPSRREVSLLQSMDHQYRARGLRVALIDATALTTGHTPDHSALLNASYDWHLEIPLLEDDSSRVARVLNIKQVPTLVLLTANGRIVQVWVHPVPPGELALAIEKVLGTSLVPKASRQAPRSDR